MISLLSVTLGCSSSDDENSVGNVNASGGEGGAGVGGSLGGSPAAGGMIAGSAGGGTGLGGQGMGGAQTSTGGSVANGGTPSGASGAPSGAAGIGGDAGAAGIGGDTGAAGIGGEGAGGMPGTPDSGVSGCSRESLAAIIDSYFAALAAHDAEAVALSAAVRSTENAREIQVGQNGLWQTAGEAKFLRSALDTERCGTVTEAVIDNSGKDTIIGLRLKIENQEITEIETFIVDPDTGFFPTPQALIASNDAIWDEILPPEQRSTREELNAAADAYFDLFSDPSADVPFGTPCTRLENGFQTTRGDCSTGIPPGSLRMTNRRYPVADLEAGIAVGFTQFGGSLLDFHMHKLIDGKIRGINAVVGPGATSFGWD